MFSLLHPGLDWQALANQYGTPLLVLDCDILRSQYRRLAEALPGVRLFYAIKALSNQDALRTLHEEGAGFDIASSGEIALLREAGIPAGDSIHTHPIKKTAEIEAALAYGCTTFVADNPAEIAKFVPYRRQASLLLRVSFRGERARCDLSRKFGCDPRKVEALIQQAEESGIRVRGLSFHVGSQSASPDAHVQAIRQCREMMARQARRGRPMEILDIGGGFPANYDGSVPGIEDYCAPIRAALEGLPAAVKVVAEPGRFLAAPAMTCVTAIIGKALRGDEIWYYLDEGVYGAFSGQIYDHARYPLCPLKNAEGPLCRSVLAGPTCDSIDVIADGIEVPEMEIGDLILAPMMGAYTAASASDFNLLPRSRIVALHAPEQNRAVLELV